MNPSTRALIDELSKREHLSILFVCLGNICRSPAAEEVTRVLAEKAGLDKQLTLDSAGLYAGHAGELPDRRMRVHAFQRGYNLTHHSRPVSASDFENFDLILSMDDSNYSRLRAFAPSPEDEKKVVRITDFCRSHPGADHVPDPYYDGAEGFERVLDLLEDACSSLIDTLKEGQASEAKTPRHKSAGRTLSALILAMTIGAGAAFAADPSFPGGDVALQEYISSNMQYPRRAFDNGIEGIVNLQFMVMADGSINSISVVKMIDPDLEQEAIRLVKAMPAWTPADNGGGPIDAKVALPVRFELPDSL